VHDLRHQDAPGRQLLRLRGMRKHLRLQLEVQLIASDATIEGQYLSVIFT